MPEAIAPADGQNTALDTGSWAAGELLAPLDSFFESDGLQFGPPLALEPSPVVEEIRALVADLALLVRDFARGPLEAHRRQCHDYLVELRRSFLRNHRRVVVQLRSEKVDDLAPFIGTEVAELAQRFRDVVLERASRLRHGGLELGPFVEAVDRAVSQLPEVVEAPVEPTSFVAKPNDAWGARVARLALRLRRWKPEPVPRAAQRPVPSGLREVPAE